MTLQEFKADNNKVIRDNSTKTDKIFQNLYIFIMLKNTKFQITTYTNIGAMRKLIFLISNTKKAFNCLKKLFIKALIF